MRLAYRLIRDFFVFTEKRLIIVEIQGIWARRSTTLPFLIDLRPPSMTASRRAKEGETVFFIGVIFGWLTAGVIYGAALWFHPWWWIGRVLRDADSGSPCSSGQISRSKSGARASVR